MAETEQVEFDSLILSAMRHGKEKTGTPHDLRSRLDFYQKALADRFSLRQIDAGINKHYQRNRWMPQPSEIITCIYEKAVPPAPRTPALPSAQYKRGRGVPIEQWTLTLYEYLALAPEFVVSGKVKPGNIEDFKKWLFKPEDRQAEEQIIAETRQRLVSEGLVPAQHEERIAR